MKASASKWRKAGRAYGHRYANIEKKGEPYSSHKVSGPYRVYRRRALWMQWTNKFNNPGRWAPGLAKQHWIRAMQNQMFNRRIVKVRRRRLFVRRVRNNCKLHGVAYEEFICRMKEADLMINRKMLSELAIYDRPIFTNVMDVACPWWPEKLRRKMTPPKEFTCEQIDEYVIPYIEKLYPNLYTDPCIRFNRKAYENMNFNHYVIQVGDPEYWRQALAKTPELANFNYPDHWMKHTNSDHEEVPITWLNLPQHWDTQKFRKEQSVMAKQWEKDAEKRAAGDKDVYPLKVGVSREDWFKDEPQSWL